MSNTIGQQNFGSMKQAKSSNMLKYSTRLSPLVDLGCWIRLSR